MPKMTRVVLRVAAALAAIEIAVALAQSNGPAPSDLPPLKVDKSTPLLLDEPARLAASPNEARQKFTMPRLICNDCHGNFLEESLAVQHAKHKVSCVDCHGLSRDHSVDESNTTPPDTMFARDAIAGPCQVCHRNHNAPAVRIITRWQQRGLQNLNPKDLVCTDCHGEHRMKVRTVHWDKKTGKIISPSPNSL